MIRRLRSFFETLSLSRNLPVIVVSGLPRSGTSLMMKMLQAGGVPLLTDHQRRADKDNPEGYYEFERVKKLRDGDTAWLPEARGSAVKVISALLSHLPADHTYQVLFMERDMEELLASQRKMLNHRRQTDEVSDEEMASLYEKHLDNTRRWIARQRNMSVLYVPYRDLVLHPSQQMEAIYRFLAGAGFDLNTQQMAGVIDPDLYRNRADSGQ